jgi:hypothetical protein
MTIMSDTETPRLAGIFSIASGLVHGVAAGLHADHAAAARSFAVLAIVQVVAGLAGLFSGDQRVRILVAGANVVSIGGWIAAKTVGIGFINGLETVEGVQATDLLCAILAAIAVSFAVAPQLAVNLNLERLSATGLAVILTVPAMVTAAGHDHGSSASDWPRPYFPGIGIDIEGVDGVTGEQEARARQLVLDTQRDLMRWSDYKVAVDEGWISIGDERTGYEHFVKPTTLIDGKFLDTTAPESIVYKVYGDTRILVSAMYMANLGTTLDDRQLTDYAGPLMQWHIHDNLCWKLGDDMRPSITGITDEGGNCPAGSRRANVEIPMVHVWVVPHPCGPFAAVEGLAEGQAAVPTKERVDICGSHSH